MHKLFQPLIEWYMGALQTGGYPLVALLMAVESSILPLPSEVVIPPAAHLAHTGQIPLSLWGIVLAGIATCAVAWGFNGAAAWGAGAEVEIAAPEELLAICRRGLRRDRA